MEDRVQWKEVKDENFFVKSFYSALEVAMHSRFREASFGALAFLLR